jgi:putative oxidoreductase
VTGNGPRVFTRRPFSKEESMSNVRSSADHVEPVTRFAADPALAKHFAAPILLLARAMMATIFVVEGYEKITGYADVAAYMAKQGVPATLLPLVILTELGGGLMVLVGLGTRWAAFALAGFCVLTAVIIHLAQGETIEFQKNLAMAGGFLALVASGPGAWSIDARLGRAARRRHARPDRRAGPRRGRARQFARGARRLRVARLRRARLAGGGPFARAGRARPGADARAGRPAGLGDVQVGL